MTWFQTLCKYLKVWHAGNLIKQCVQEGEEVSPCRASLRFYEIQWSLDFGSSAEEWDWGKTHWKQASAHASYDTGCSSLPVCSVLSSWQIWKIHTARNIYYRFLTTFLKTWEKD